MEAVPDVVSEAIDRAIVERARVDVCVGNADLDVLGEIVFGQRTGDTEGLCI